MAFLRRRAGVVVTRDGDAAVGATTLRAAGSDAAESDDCAGAISAAEGGGSVHAVDAASCDGDSTPRANEGESEDRNAAPGEAGGSAASASSNEGDGDGEADADDDGRATK